MSIVISLTMPGYWAGASQLSARGGGGSEVRATIRPGRWIVYDNERPAGGFDLPMNDLSARPDEEVMTYEEHRSQLEATGRYYWMARCYRNYQGNLDFYVEFKGDDYVHHYELTMPTRVVDSETYADVPNYGADATYPAPSQWYLAVGKNYVRKISSSEYAAMGTAVSDDTIAGEDTMAAGSIPASAAMESIS